MPSRINQMRNGQIPMQPQQNQSQPQPQLQINQDYINSLKAIMRSKNSEQLVSNLASQNPQVAQIIQFARSGGNLQSLANIMAQQKNLDINQVLNSLM